MGTRGGARERDRGASVESGRGIRRFLQRRRRLFRGLVLLGVLAIAVLVLVDRHVGAIGDQRVFTELDRVPERPVALVLGTAPRLASGRVNAYFRSRVEAASELYRAGKVRGLLLSGDGSELSGDEPGAMREELRARGVPVAYLTLDRSGFRTVDSVIRAREVFGQDRLIIVSQRFHAQRAVYLAHAHGIDAIGYAAEDVSRVRGTRVRLREVLARSAAWLEVNVLGTRPKELGDPRPVGLREAGR